MTAARRALAPAATAAAALALSGCSLNSLQATEIEYVPSDGGVFRADNGVGIYNALLLTEGLGSPGSLSARIVNNSFEDVTVRMVTSPAQDSPDEVPTLLQGEFDVPARSSVQIGPESDLELFVDEVTQRGGQVLQVAVDPGDGQVGELDVFVIGGVLDEYEDLVPVGEATP